MLGVQHSSSSIGIMQRSSCVLTYLMGLCCSLMPLFTRSRHANASIVVCLDTMEMCYLCHHTHQPPLQAFCHLMPASPTIPVPATLSLLQCAKYVSQATVSCCWQPPTPPRAEGTQTLKLISQSVPRSPSSDQQVTKSINSTTTSQLVLLRMQQDKTAISKRPLCCMLVG